jgi:hypothetical protein
MICKMKIFGIIISPIISIIAGAMAYFIVGPIILIPPGEIRFGIFNNGKQSKKVALWTSLFTRFHKGKNVSGLFVRLHHDESSHTFSRWYHGVGQPVRGGGLFIGPIGVPDVYYFLLPDEGRLYEFSEGNYLLQVFIERIDKSPKKVFEQLLVITTEQAQQMKDRGRDIVYVWLPLAKKYMGRVEDL